MAMSRRRAFDRAVERWPAFDVPFEAFCLHLERLGFTHSLPAHLSDIYLCSGCGLGLRAACRALEEHYMSGLRLSVRRVARQPDLVEDVLQDVRDRLLVGPTPRINTYRGNGPLDSWLRVIAIRVAMDHRRSGSARRRRGLRFKHEQARPQLDPWGSALLIEDGPLKYQAAQLCEHGLRSAIWSLPPDERQLLQQHFVLGLSIDVLGAIWSIDRSTAARRIRRVLRTIRAGLRQQLAQWFVDLSHGELDSLMIDSYAELDIDAPMLLGPVPLGVEPDAREPSSQILLSPPAPISLPQ
jgi:RNA polymerase sigma-70 factor (ECF subfamily)